MPTDCRLSGSGFPSRLEDSLAEMWDWDLGIGCREPRPGETWGVLVLKKKVTPRSKVGLWKVGLKRRSAPWCEFYEKERLSLMPGNRLNLYELLPLLFSFVTNSNLRLVAGEVGRRGAHIWGVSGGKRWSRGFAHRNPSCLNLIFLELGF